VCELDAEIAVVYQLIFSSDRGEMGHLVVDVLSRDPVRRCLAIGTEGSILWNWADHAVRVFSPADGWHSIEEGQQTLEPGYVNAEEPYVQEMAAFLAAVRGQVPWPYSLFDDIATLKVLTAAEDSAQTGRQITLA
jgi:predicted dehydrogenase